MQKLETKEQYNELIAKEDVVFLFSADWCPDCRIIEPELPAIEVDYPEYTFVYVDRDDFIEICQENDIFGIPSFIAYRGGKEAGRFVSKQRKTKEEIEEFLDGLEG
ncbi:thioredoxin family protein [Aciduricibacillus chroicocephali]|uniref:Thioredoxin family protein n=1 Tax=Aciduricibacillus chroicocephali TaxID=3054939 RepID=A0ABY9KU84_9BACI|nr:thioredoxin family protein [Bacillaceae bacterium 44XB]